MTNDMEVNYWSISLSYIELYIKLIRNKTYHKNLPAAACNHTIEVINNSM